PRSGRAWSRRPDPSRPRACPDGWRATARWTCRSPAARLRADYSGRGLTAVSHYFYMDVASLAVDLVLGFLIAGALAASVPNSVWHALFFTSHPAVSAIWGPFIGPLIAVLTFVCSVGNIPLAVVLWNGG